jgi:hypothetical protein
MIRKDQPLADARGQSPTKDNLDFLADKLFDEPIKDTSESQSLSAEAHRLQEEVRQKETEIMKLEENSIETLNSAFIVLRRFSDIIEADDFIEDSRRRIQHARPDERVRVICDVLQSTSTLIDIVEARRWGQ